MSPKGLAICAIVALGCRSSQDPVGFGSISSMVTTLPEGTTGESSSSGLGVDSSSSTTSSISGTGSSTGPRLDLGDKPDIEPPQPAGCKGKIDFLFVISSSVFVEDMQEQLVDAFPKFIDTIQTKFEDFDYQIMVVDGGADWWGNLHCNEDCPMTPEKWGCVGYPCDQLDLVGPCETTWGAGTVFNAGFDTMNKPCGVAGGKRYLTREQPQLEETFECVARVGATGGDLVGYALAQAVSPELIGPGGCNGGFLRDDALLVVTLASRSPDDNSPGSPPAWAQSVIEAKHDDPNAIVAFGITGSYKNADECWDNDRVCQVVRQFPYSYWIYSEEPDYGPGFDIATDLVETACGAFIPQ